MPVVWEYNVQLISDIIISKDGRPGTVRESGTKQVVPLYLSATDMLMADQFPLPRLVLGAFLKGLEVNVREAFGLTVEYTGYGKPEPMMFEYLERRFHANDESV